MRQTVAVVAVVAAIATFASSASAATRFAEPNGTGPASGANACPESDPCSFKAAVSNASVADQDTVIVLPGAYEDQSGFFSVDRAITIESRLGSPVPVVPVSNGGFGLIATNPGVIVRGLRLTSNLGIALYFPDGGIAERVFAQTTAQDQFACVLGDNSLIRDSVCHATNGPVEGGGVVLGISGAVTAAATLRNVTAVGEGAGSYGVFAQSINGARLTLDAKNVIANGQAADARAITEGSPMGTAIVSLSNSNFNSPSQAGSGAQVVDGGGNQAPPAVFADAAFHQAATSPTLDAGSSSASLLGALDLDAELRSLDGNCDGVTAPDIGADEFNGNCPAPPPSTLARDTTPPQTTITKSPPNRDDANSVKFKFKSSEPGSSFKCKIDAKPFKRCRSPKKLSVDEGKHRFKVVAVDPAGNADPTPGKDKFKVVE